MERVILSLNLDAEAVSVVYLTLPTDLRETGLAQQHSLLIPAGGDYDDEIEAVRDAALALLEDALEDFEKVPPYELVEPDGDDDDDED